MRTVISTDLTGLGDPVIVFTLGRSGTHMTIDLIRRHFAAFASWKYPGEFNSGVYTWLDALIDPAQVMRSLRRMRRATRPTLMTHYWPDVRATLARDQPEVARWLAERGRIVHVVRNPRHAISSAWPIENERARRGLQTAPQLEDYVERVGRRWAADIEAMRNEPRYIMLRFEDLLREPRRGVERIGHHLGETPLWREPVFATPYPTVTSARLSRIFTMRPASTASIVSRAVRRRYKLCWTPGLNATLSAAAGAKLGQFGYHEDGSDGPQTITATSALDIDPTKKFMPFRAGHRSLFAEK